jgi:hypothetical protein
MITIEELSGIIQKLDWWDLRIYDLNDVGKNHGILLGTRGWTP